VGAPVQLAAMENDNETYGQKSACPIGGSAQHANHGTKEPPPNESHVGFD